MKYFIEREDGMWLMPPDSMDPGPWTRDPNKAWQFDLIPPTKEDFDRSFMDEFMYGESVVRITNEGVPVLNFLKEEELMPGLSLKITEHEFVNMSVNPDSKSDLFVDRSNHDIWDVNFGRVGSTASEFFTPTTRRI